MNEKHQGEVGLSGPADKCVPADGGTKWSHRHGWLQERAKDMTCLSRMRCCESTSAQTVHQWCGRRLREAALVAIG